MNLVHPKPNERNAEALKALAANELRSTDTWESKLTEAGQKAKSEKEKANLKAAAWRELLENNKLGYFALLRNLRNILQQAPELVDMVCKQLTNRNRIKRSLVMPFRFLSALDVIQNLDLNDIVKAGKRKNKGNRISLKRKVENALNKALEISLDNVPVFEGSTLIVLDDSGSMTCGRVKGMNKRPIDIGALFASVLFKTNNADLMCFSDNARYMKYNSGDALQSLTKRLVDRARSGGTNFHAIF